MLNLTSSQYISDNFIADSLNLINSSDKRESFIPFPRLFNKAKTIKAGFNNEK